MGRAVVRRGAGAVIFYTEPQTSITSPWHADNLDAICSLFDGAKRIQQEYGLSGMDVVQRLGIRESCLNGCHTIAAHPAIQELCCQNLVNLCFLQKLKDTPPEQVEAKIETHRALLGAETVVMGIRARNKKGDFVHKNGNFLL